MLKKGTSPLVIQFMLTIFWENQDGSQEPYKINKVQCPSWSVPRMVASGDVTWIIFVTDMMILLTFFLAKLEKMGKMLVRYLLYHQWCVHRSLVSVMQIPRAWRLTVIKHVQWQPGICHLQMWLRLH